MALKIISATHRGLDGVLISVEVDITRGIPSFNIIEYISKIIKDGLYTQLYYREVLKIRLCKHSKGI